MLSLAWKANDNVLIMVATFFFIFYFFSRGTTTTTQLSLYAVFEEQELVVLASSPLFLLLTRFTTSNLPEKAIGHMLHCFGECVDSMEYYIMLIHSFPCRFDL